MAVGAFATLWKADYESRFPAEKASLATLIFIFMAMSVVYATMPPEYFIGGVAILLIASIPLMFPSLGFRLAIILFPVTTFNLFINSTAYVYGHKIIFPAQYPLYIPIMFFTFAGFVIRIKRQPLPNLTETPLGPLALLLYAYSWLALLWTPDLRIGLSFLSMFTCNILLYFLIVAATRDVKGIERLMDLGIIAGLVSSCGVFATAYSEDFELSKMYLSDSVGLTYGISRVMSGPAGFENIPGGFIMPIAIFAGARAVASTDRSRKILFSIITLILVSGGLMPQARSPLLGLVAGVGVILLLHERTRRRFFSRFIAFLTVLVIVILTVAPGTLDKVAITLGIPQVAFFTKKAGVSLTSHKVVENTSGIGFRVKLFSESLDTMTKTPYKFLTGYGPGGFSYYNSKHLPEHGFILSFYFESGFFGLTILLAIVVTAIIRLKNVLAIVDRSSPAYIYVVALAGSLVGMVCVHGATDYDIITLFGKVPWFFLAAWMSATGVVILDHKMNRVGKAHLKR